MHSTRLTALAAALSAALVHPTLAETIRIGMQQEPTVLDPTADATAAIDVMLAQNVYESLTTVGESGEVLPQLAESWTISEDGLVYTFSLVEGASFHDGTTFDAEDVVFSFDRARAEGSVNPSAGIWTSIESVAAPDPQTVEVRLTGPDAFFLFNLAQGDASIVAPESAETNVTAPIGTGPFKYEDWTRGDRLVLTAFDGHRNAETVALERVEFRFVADPAAATAALLAEEIDAFPSFPAPELVDQFDLDPRFDVVLGSSEGEVILALNNSRAPFDTLEVRQGIAHAIDRDEIIAGAMYGRAKPIGSFYPPHGPAHIDLTGTYPHDAARATELFEAADVSGTEVTLRLPPFPYATRSGEIIQAQLGAAGLNVAIESVEWGFWIDEVFRNGNYDMTVIAHTSPNDLGNFARGEDYYYGFQSDAFDALWEEIRTEADPEVRNALLQDAQRYLAEKAVHGFLFQLPRLGVYKAGITGFWANSPVLYQPLTDVRMN
ncbi:MAG: ABC transporter substrate-binding protein [Pseudomonadota bacterium]